MMVSFSKQTFRDYALKVEQLSRNGLADIREEVRSIKLELQVIAVELAKLRNELNDESMVLRMKNECEVKLKEQSLRHIKEMAERKAEANRLAEILLDPEVKAHIIKVISEQEKPKKAKAVVKKKRRKVKPDWGPYYDEP